MTLVQSIIISALEGLTEFLPISSTGHLLLAEKILQIHQTDFTKTFNIIIQLAAIMAVVWTYKNRLFSDLDIWKKTLTAFIPTAVTGLVFYRLIRDYLFESPSIIVASLFIGGLILLFIESVLTHKSKNPALTYKNSFIIGLFQSLSVIPGVSRSAATIVGGLATGLTRQRAVEFSFFLAIPTMLAASGLDLFKSGLHFSAQEYQIILIGCLVSFFSALITVKTFLKLIQKLSLKFFGYYRLLISILLYLYLLS